MSDDCCASWEFRITRIASQKVPDMNFLDAVKTCLVKYTNYSDRASRSEFWLFIPFIFIISLMLISLDPLMGGLKTHIHYYVGFVLVYLPGVSVSVRRLHDVNRSGFWLLGAFTIIGMLFPILYWWCKKGDQGENKFGPKPVA